MIPEFVATMTSSKLALEVSRLSGRCANPVLRFLTRPSSELSIQPCQDWEKLSDLFRRHRSANHITSDRSTEFLHWRYGENSPLSPCAIYLFRDRQGNEGWFSLGSLIRGGVRRSFLLDAIWPQGKISFSRIFQEILCMAATGADAIVFRRRPGVEYREHCRWLIPRRLTAPGAFVITPKGAGLMPLESLDYDDSDYIAWMFHWNCDE
jgi:hypothetical protein